MFGGTVAIVTGGGSGIGHAIALRLARLGAAVVVAGRREGPLEDTVAQIEGAGGRALAVPTDLAKIADIEALVAGAEDRFGRVDHVINNAVMNYGGRYDEVTLDQLNHMIDVSFTAPLVLSRLALPGMIARRSGSIVMIGSTAYVGWPYVVTYSSIKAGLDGFCQALRRELAGSGIHVTAVHPGGTDTPSMTPTARREFEALGFVILPPEVVASATVAAIRRRKPRVIIGGWEKRHVALSNLDPRLIDRTLKRMRPGFRAAMNEHQTPSP